METIKLKDAIEKYGDHQIDVKELEKILAPAQPAKPKTIWDLKEGDQYFYLDGIGNINSCRWDDLSFDCARRMASNAFLTREEANIKIQIDIIETSLKKYTTPIDEFDWTDDSQPKYRLCIKYANKKIFLCPTTDYNIINSRFYFENKKTMDEAVKEIGMAKLIRYFMDVL